MSFQSSMSPSQLFGLCTPILWPPRRPPWVTFCNSIILFFAETDFPNDTVAAVSVDPTNLDEPRVVESVPQLQDLLLNHSSVVHLVA